jgi:hypothetical protein
MHEMLGYLGWEVDIASGGSGTLAVYERARRAGRPYGLVILDARSTEESSEIHGFARAVRHDVEVRMVLCADDADEAAADAAADESHIFDAHLWRPFRCVDVHRMLG